MRHYCILISLLFCMPIMAVAELEFGHLEFEIKA